MSIEKVIIALIDTADYLWSKQPKGYLTMIDNIDEALSEAMQEWSWE